ncbi:MAG TPA: class I SAM-dependent methyltransferase [Candidatus Angelobacter sp.]|nr:class I SAM-dependent methyltransferase [Candidatus Angelobacter sp.]
MDTITSSVNAMYERYPYPYTGVKPEPLIDLYVLVHMLFAEAGIDDSEISQYSFFDGGCGSGQRILGLAAEFPHASFTGVDMTESSLNIAREQAVELGINNVTFRKGNLLELNERGKYDVVTSVGVVHHLSNPATGVKNLSDLVAESGILILHVYHTLGEHKRMLQRELARMLTGARDLDFGIGVVKDLGLSLPPEYYGKYGYNSNLTETDQLAKDIDVYLHPRVFTYRFAEGVELLKSSGLDWVAINSVNTPSQSYFVSASCPPDGLAFDPLKSLSTDRLRASYESLALGDRLRTIELLIEPTSFSMIAGRDDGLHKIGPRLRDNLIRL